MFAGLALLGAIVVPTLASAEILRVGGYGAVMELLRQIGPAFTAATGHTLLVIPRLGSRGGNAALADEVLNMSAAGRPLTEKEVAMGLAVATTLRTPFGFVTSRSGPDGLSSAEIAAIYRAQKPTWPDGTAIRIFLRPVDDSDNLVLGSFAQGMPEALKNARKRPDLSLAATDQDNADMAEATAGSLVGATLAQIMTEKRRLRFVAIDGVVPTVANFEDGSYPHIKNIYFIVPANVSPQATAFLSFIASSEGKRLLRDAGIVAGAK